MVNTRLGCAGRRSRATQPKRAVMMPEGLSRGPEGAAILGGRAYAGEVAVEKVV